METNIVDERMGFVTDFASGHWSMTELCERVLTCRVSSDQLLLENSASLRGPAFSDRNQSDSAAGSIVNRAYSDWG